MTNMPELAGAHWFKSSWSQTQDACVEAALIPGHAGVRDTKDRNGGTLVFDAQQWNAFLGRLNAGQFDL